MGGHRKSASIAVDFSKIPEGGLQAISGWKPAQPVTDGFRKVSKSKMNTGESRAEGTGDAK